MAYHKSSKLSWDHLKPRAKVVQQKSLREKKKNSFKPKVKTKRQGKAKQVVGSAKELQMQRTDGRTPDKKRSLNRGREGGRDGRERREDDNDDEDEDEGDAERSNQDDDEHEQGERKRERKRERERQRARSTTFHDFYSLTILTFHVSPFSQNIWLLFLCLITVWLKTGKKQFWGGRAGGLVVNRDQGFFLFCFFFLKF